MNTHGWGDLASLLEQHAPDLVRLEVRTLRHHRFRWLVLVELLVGLVVFSFCCALIAFAAFAVAVAGEGDLDLDIGQVGAAPRFWDYWQELEVRGIVAEGEPAFVLRHTPQDADERDAVVRQVLAHAQREALVVVEGLGGDLPELLQAWYGGQPLLAPPEERDLADATAVLAQLDWDAEPDAVLHLTRTGTPGGRVWSFFALILQLAVLPLAIFDTSVLDALRNTWWDVRGLPPGCWRAKVDGDALSLGWYREDLVRHEAVLHRTDVIGIAFCPTLGFDRDVKRKRPRLAVITRDETVRWPLDLEPREGRALRDALVSACIMAWEGVPTTLQRPTRCPWCSSLYTFQAGVACPSCGGWPDRVGFVES